MNKECLPPMGGRHSLLFSLGQTIAHADLRKEVFGLGGVFLDFAADIGHVDPEDLIVSSCPGTPQLLDDGVVSQHFAGIFAQQGDDPEFAEGEVHIFTPDQYLVLVVVDVRSPTVYVPFWAISLLPETVRV